MMLGCWSSADGGCCCGQVIAVNLPPDEIAGLKEVFDAMDADHR
jgi:hypothetical protein